MDNLFGLLETAAQRFPANKFAVYDPPDYLSYQQFLDQVRIIAAEWMHQELQSGSLIIIAEKNPLKTLELLFAAWALDCSVMLIAPDSFPFVQASIIPLANPSLIAYDGQVTLNTSGPQITNDKPHIIVFTSGTASSPKGVILSHSSILANAEGILQYITLGEDDRSLIVKSLYHIASISGQVIPALLSGSSIVFPGESKSPQYLAQKIVKEQITYIDTVATLWRYIIRSFQEANLVPDSLRFVSVNGEHVTPTELDRFKQSLPHGSLFYAYGQTEAGPRITYLPNDAIKTKPTSVGVPLPGVQLRIGEDRQSFYRFADPAPTNYPVGEVLIQSPSMMLGYWKNPDLTAIKLNEGWLHTGDIGFLDEDGFLYLLGRSDDIIIRGGQTVYSQEIEDAIMTVKWVHECTVKGEPDAMNGQKIVAYIAVDNSTVDSRAVLYKHLRLMLPSCLIPQEIVFCTALPQTTSGKINKRKV